jgi:hypothetical protein
LFEATSDLDSHARCVARVPGTRTSLGTSLDESSSMGDKTSQKES